MIVLDEEIYILSYEKDSTKKLVYAPKRGCVELIDQHLADCLNNGMITTESSLVKELIKTIQKTPEKDLDVMKNGFPELNIDLSNGCNMRCIYCYAGRGEGRVKYQKKEDIDLILDAYFRYLYNLPSYQENATCSIIFTNDAEPTFAPDLLKYTVITAIEKAKRFKIKPIFLLPTNGAFDEGLRAFIIKYFNIVSCSFDGVRDVQNHHRPLNNNKPSFDRVYENVQALYQSGIKLIFSVVVTRYNIDYLNETIDFFDKNFPGSSVSFGQIHLSGRALEDKKDIGVDQQHFDERFIAALKYGKLTSIKVRGKHGHMSLMPRSHYCSSTAKPNWSISLTGEIYACMEEKSEDMKIGWFDFEQRELNFDQGNIKILGRKTVDCNEKCCECFAKYLCAGGCVSKNESQAALCSGIRERNVHFVNHAYEEKMMRVEARRLFNITEDKERR
jgi:radical SAM protein with 4Fe4S-binding SPASM domain